MKHADTHIAVFCKAPVAGRVKTRLIETYGAVGAARIYTTLVEKTLRTVDAACAAFDMSASLWIADDPLDLDALRWSHDHGLPRHTQQGNDLGARMLHSLQTMQHAGYARVLLIGTDCPAFTPAHFSQAATALEWDSPWVFTPAEDGGYTLVGTRAASAQPFSGIAWSTDAVMQQTRDALREARLRWTETATLWDVDHPADVQRARDAALI